jgi:hypothetical protein
LPFNPKLCRNESEVESKLIVQYLLPKLGYSPDNWHQEVAFGNIRLDFLAFAAQAVPFVLDANSPWSVVMEAKHPNQNLNSHVRRLKHYLTSLNVRYGLLTNGKELRIYQTNQNNVQLVFQCFGKEIDTRFDEIKALIGRDSIKAKQFTQTLEAPIHQNSQPQTISLSNPEIKRQDSMKVIAVYHNKGGVGKTTVAVNLAAALSQKGKNVLLIDIDSQANTTFATGLIKFQFEEDDDLKDRNVYHLLESGDFNFIPNIIRQSQYFNNPETNVIPSHITLFNIRINLIKLQPAEVG